MRGTNLLPRSAVRTIEVVKLLREPLLLSLAATFFTRVTPEAFGQTFHRSEQRENENDVQFAHEEPARLKSHTDRNVFCEYVVENPPVNGSNEETIGITWRKQIRSYDLSLCRFNDS